MQLTIDVTNLEWLDQKSPLNHSFKGFGPTDLLLPQFIFLNPIFGLELRKETCFPERKSSFLNVV
jgi:hypothetical protein